MSTRGISDRLMNGLHMLEHQRHLSRLSNRRVGWRWEWNMIISETQTGPACVNTSLQPSLDIPFFLRLSRKSSKRPVILLLGSSNIKTTTTLRSSKLLDPHSSH